MTMRHPTVKLITKSTLFAMAKIIKINLNHHVAIKLCSGVFPIQLIEKKVTSVWPSDVWPLKKRKKKG